MSYIATRTDYESELQNWWKIVETIPTGGIPGNEAHFYGRAYYGHGTADDAATYARLRQDELAEGGFVAVTQASADELMAAAANEAQDTVTLDLAIDALREVAAQ